jgi:hypothetical protein
MGPKEQIPLMKEVKLIIIYKSTYVQIRGVGELSVQ